MREFVLHAKEVSLGCKKEAHRGFIIFKDLPVFLYHGTRRANTEGQHARKMILGE